MSDLLPDLARVLAPSYRVERELGGATTTSRWTAGWPNSRLPRGGPPMRNAMNTFAVQCLVFGGIWFRPPLRHHDMTVDGTCDAAKPPGITWGAAPCDCGRGS